MLGPGHDQGGFPAQIQPASRQAGNPDGALYAVDGGAGDVQAAPRTPPFAGFSDPRSVRPDPLRREGAIRGGLLRLQVRDDDGVRELQFATGVAVTGRDPSCDIYLHDGSSSRQHGRFEQGGDGWLYLDVGSMNRSLFNGVPLQPWQGVVVRRGDVLTIGGALVTVVDAGPAHFSQHAPQEPVAAQPFSAPPAPMSRQPDAGMLRVGRAIDNDIVIDDSLVSSYHLEARVTGGGLAVCDLGSRNGTFVDGQRITETVVPPGAVLRLGQEAMLPAAAILARLSVAPQPSQFTLRPAESEHLLAARGLGRVVGNNRKVILRDVDISVRRGEFIAIAGASGAGKSTLMKILNGYTAPDAGSLLIARNMYGEHEIGYVPQDDILHRELPLREALVLSAILRYPPETPREVVERRADEVLSELGLTEHAATLVARLSGGQRKRASVALELMTKPRLLLLDEPTSGLDPGSDRRLMALLRALADSGIGIVLITHATANIAACDTVGFLAPGGYLVFWGSPDEAKRYFGAKTFDEVYETIESEGSPEEWRHRFERSDIYRRLYEEANAGLQELAAVAQGPFAPPPPESTVLKWQLKALARRYYRTLLGDRRNLTFFLIQVPVIVLLTKILFAGNVLIRAHRESLLAAARRAEVIDSPTKGCNLIFIVSVSLVFFGTINAAREICKELAIWERERHVGVRPLPYVLSKLVVLGGLCAVQTLTMVLAVSVLWKVPGGGGAMLGLLVIGFLTALSGVAVGLAISSAVPSPDRAMALAPLAIIPQILFGGVVIPLAEMKGLSKLISAVAASRWTFQAIGQMTHRADYLPKFVDITFNGQRQRIANPAIAEYSGSWTGEAFALLVLCAVFIAVTTWLVARGGASRPAGMASIARQVPAGPLPAR